MNSPLQLERYHLVAVRLEPTGLERPAERQDVHVQVTVGHLADNVRAWRVELTVDFGGRENPCAPFHGSVRMEGFFVVHPEFPEAKGESLVRVNGAAILYGAIRETVSNLTARSRTGMYVLPSISFLDLLDKKKGAKSKTAIPGSRTVRRQSGS